MSQRLPNTSRICLPILNSCLGRKTPILRPNYAGREVTITGGGELRLRLVIEHRCVRTRARSRLGRPDQPAWPRYATGARHSPQAADKNAWRTAFSGLNLTEGTPNGECRLRRRTGRRRSEPALPGQLHTRCEVFQERTYLFHCGYIDYAANYGRVMKWRLMR